MLTVCHTARVALRVPKVQGSAPSQGRCETCGGEAHLGLPEVGPEDVLGIVSSSPLATQWREVLLEADLEERPSLAPLRVCASLEALPSPPLNRKIGASAEEEKAELELRVVADPLALAQRARLAIYPPWRLGPHLRFSWRLEAREETPPAVPAPELRQKPRRPRALTGIGGVSGGFGGGSDSSFDVHMDPELLETQAAPQPFQLLSHLEEAEAPEGLQLPLRAHQLQSLAWMQACEGEREPLLLGASREFLPALQPPHAAQQALVEAVKCRAVARVQRAFEVRGGVLADQVGSGKTAVTLALVVSDRNSHQASRTLVLAPGRLLQQWQHEAWKFLDRGMQVLDEDLRVAPVEPGEPQLLVAPVELLSSKRRLEEDSFATRLRRLQLSRLVVDEFHELSDGALAQLRPPSPATAPMALWGLTGTPALEGFGSVARLAQVFAVELGVFRRQLDAAALAQKALDYLARAQGAGCRLTSHPVHEELVTLHHTPAERALYAQHAAEARKGRLAAPELLQLCSHFHLTEKDTDAEAESAQLLRARQDAKATAKEWLALAAAKVAQQVPRMIKAAESEVLAEQYAQLLAEVGTAPHAEHAQLAGARAAGARQNAGRHEREADALILEAMRVEEASEESQGAEVFGDGLELLEDLKQAKEAFRQRSCEVAFLSAMLDAAENQSFRCPICLNEPEPTERAILAACAHLFCLQCASTLARRGECALCRQTLRKGEAAEVVRVREPGAVEEQLERKRWGRFGSKIFQVVRKLHKIEEQDPRARAIVFVQWAALRRKLAAAFTEFQVPFVCLEEAADGRALNFWERDDVVGSFQNAPEDSTQGPKVLLLSLQDAASGTNLTRANHVLFVHPMLAKTSRLSVAYEQQALGRCLRLGQTRPVYLWRFVTLGTAEEDLSYRHQQELWRGLSDAPRHRRAASASAEAAARERESESDVDLDDLFW
ncbi:unnamed protein product [Effrenium voratum]|uniref:Uncharacterized protein n=2 Tax=Effrenium voratum TaxID=2562239 RepID=A0AA36MQ01_9DINO|nr:unnamed protein product [Effrenium voratum]